MRLIDADKFEADLENSCSTEMESIAFVNFLAYLDEQPTAFDVDKVIEKLSNEMAESYAEDEYKYGNGISLAIDVIKGGGQGE